MRTRRYVVSLKSRLFIVSKALQALQHILNKSGYKYVKPYEIRSRVQLSTGRGIVWAEGKSLCTLIILVSIDATLFSGEQHAKHRKIMNPAFSSSALRVFLPLFFDTAHKVWCQLSKLNQTPSNVTDRQCVENTTLSKRYAFICYRCLILVDSCDFGYHRGCGFGMQL